MRTLLGLFAACALAGLTWHRKLLRKLLPLPVRMLTTGIVVAIVILMLTDGTRMDAIGPSLFAVLIPYAGGLQAVALLRYRRLPAPADDPHLWTPPERPDPGPSWRAR